VSPLVSLLAGEPGFTSLASFPFQTLGAAALIIFFLMAATSHDFWLASLTPPVWKALHMGVYAAYALVVMHVALGALQSESSPALAVALGTGMTLVLVLHVVAALRERGRDRESQRAPDGWIDAGTVTSIPDKRARIVCAGGERVAIFRYDGKVSAVSNLCQHQNGPLGEGKILDGCITCPWHGYQYLPESGRSPEPFTEKIPTFRVRVVDGRVWVDPVPNPPGTTVPPAAASAEAKMEAGGVRAAPH
jgi:nitrite reductase/ring-hydroxylating ferredoxin subunit